MQDKIRVNGINYVSTVNEPIYSPEYTIETATVNYRSKPKYSGSFRVVDSSLVGATIDASGNELTQLKDIYIKEVIYNDPATIVLWSDGSKTVTKCAEGDIYSAEAGLTICILKKLIGGASLHNLLEDWLPTQGNRVSLRNVRNKYK